MIKDETDIIGFDEHADISTHWVTSYTNGNIKTYFGSFAVLHILAYFGTFQNKSKKL